MAAPPEITIKNLNGKFVMNKSLSDDSDVLLSHQGISWLTRKAIGLATVTLTIKTYTDAASALHIDVTSNASGLTSTQEDRTLDYQARAHSDRIFGNVSGKSKVVTLSNPADLTFQTPGLSDADRAFLLGQTDKDGKAVEGFLDEEGGNVLSWALNLDKGYGWSAEQIWGFENVGGARRHARRIVVRDAKGRTVRGRLVYDYLGEAAKADGKGDDGLAYGEE